MRDGKLWAIGAVADVLTPDTLNQVFDVNVAILDTPVGPQICPLSPSSHSPPSETVELASKAIRTVSSDAGIASS